MSGSPTVSKKSSCRRSQGQRERRPERGVGTTLKTASKGAVFCRLPTDRQLLVVHFRGSWSVPRTKLALEVTELEGGRYPPYQSSFNQALAQTVIDSLISGIKK